MQLESITKEVALFNGVDTIYLFTTFTSANKSISVRKWLSDQAYQNSLITLQTHGLKN